MPDPAPEFVPGSVDVERLVPQLTSPGMADVLIAWAGRGGVGKTTVALALAQRGAAAGLRVILVDANVGQGDLRDVLRIGHAGLPSIYQTALSGDLRHALIDPDTLTACRPRRLDRVDFALLQAPPDHLAEHGMVTPQVYAHAIDQAREMCDLVVLDTQIVEARDTSGMVEDLYAPLLRTGAWGLGVTDLSTPGFANLARRLRMFTDLGVSAEQMLTLLNKLPAGFRYNIKATVAEFSKHSTFLGSVVMDEAIQAAMNQGQMVHTHPSLAPRLDAALHKVTGMESFTGAHAARHVASHALHGVPGRSRTTPGRRGMLTRLMPPRRGRPGNGPGSGGTERGAA